MMEYRQEEVDGFEIVFNMVRGFFYVPGVLSAEEKIIIGALEDVILYHGV